MARCPRASCACWTCRRAPIRCAMRARANATTKPVVGMVIAWGLKRRWRHLGRRAHPRPGQRQGIFGEVHPIDGGRKARGARLHRLLAARPHPGVAARIGRKPAHATCDNPRSAAHAAASRAMPARSSPPSPCLTPTAPCTWATWWATSRPTSGCARRMSGDRVHFVSADDTHGAPIMLAAERPG